MKKSDATREHILKSALRLFKRRGVDKATMRDIAAEAGVALGAAYYYFASKEDILLAWYLRNQEEHEARARPLLLQAGNLRQRLGVLMHSKFDAIKNERKLLGAVTRRLADPGDPISAFASQTHAVRARSIATFAAALDGEPFAAELSALAGPALWMLHLGIMLYFVSDDSPGQQRTRRLVDDALDLVTPLIYLAASPMSAPLREQLGHMLSRAFGGHVTPHLEASRTMRR